jgi:hypothetical protein
VSNLKKPRQSSCQRKLRWHVTMMYKYLTETNKQIPASINSSIFPEKTPEAKLTANNIVYIIYKKYNALRLGITSNLRQDALINYRILKNMVI